MKLLIITQKVDENDSVLGFFNHWLEKFSEKFERITVICLQKGEYRLPANVKVLSLGKENKGSKLGYLIRFYKYIWLERKNYDAVFIHMNPVWVIVGWFVWKISGKKIYFWYAHRSVTFKLKLAAFLSDKIFTSTSEGFRLQSKKLIIVGQGIDAGLFRPNPKSEIRNSKLKILSVGRISPIKNYEILIEAAKLLKEEKTDFLITIIGSSESKSDMEYEASLKNLVANYGLEESFKFRGGISYHELPWQYQSHDLFINISKTGSLDKAILEAMACGNMVISSNESAVKFLPQDLIVSGNDPRELADKIKLTNLNYRPELRDYVVNNHSLKSLIEKISRVISGA